MSEDLKSCPFCGGEPRLTHDHYVHDDLRPMAVVECKSCSAWVRAVDWNRRAALSAQQSARGLQAAVDQLAEIERSSAARLKCIDESLDQQSAPEPVMEQTGKLLVSAEPLRQVLNALVNAPHMIRELQATREPVALFADNPINVLIAEFNAAHGGEK